MIHWLYLKLRRVRLKTCLAGRCRCRSSAECRFARCPNCDGCVDAEGQTLEDRAVRDDYDWCSDCGAGFGKLLGPL